MASESRKLQISDSPQPVWAKDGTRLGHAHAMDNFNGDDDDTFRQLSTLAGGSFASGQWYVA